MGPNTVFWHSNSYSDIRKRAEYRILTLKILFFHVKWGRIYHILTFKILPCHSNCCRISYFDIQNPILAFEIGLKSHYDIQNPILKFENEPNIVFWHSKSYLAFELRPNIVLWHSKSYFDIQNRAEYFDILKNVIFLKVCNWAAEGVRMTLEITSWSICRKIWDPHHPRLCSKTVWLATESTLGPTKVPVRLAMLMRKGIDIYIFMFGFNIHEVSYHKLYDEYSIHSTV